MAGADWEGELARLRERAYGRDADILRDAAARARLEELERRQFDASGGVDTPGIGGPDPEGTDDTAAEASTAPPPPEPVAATPVRRRRRLAVWWIVSLVGAAALGAAAATAVVEASGAHEAILHPAAAPTVGSAFDPTDVQSIRYYESLAGIHVASGVIAGRPCLTVWTGATASAAALHCGTAQFPPSVDLVLDNARGEFVPTQAIERFGRGAIIRLSLVGSVVTVDVVGQR